VNIALLRPPASSPPGAHPAVPSGPAAPPAPGRTARTEPDWPGAATTRPDGAARSTGLGDRPVLAVLALCFAALTALTWRKWGVPEIDSGAELTTADLIKHGAVLYRDVRYYYGPLGLYSLALSFKLFGTSFTTAYAFGLVQAAAICAAFYALARQWLAPLSAGLASAVLLAIGFSGTAFNFVLPHTNSGTIGLLCLLLTLLALTRERLVLAGVAAGLVCLTRPEFAAVAAGALAAFVVARWRFEGRAAALRAAWRLALPAIAIPALVFGWFAMRVGLHDLIAENLWPSKFVQVGAKTEQSWMPFTLGSIVGLAARAAIYLGLLAALVASVELWRRRRGAARLLACWPLLVALAAIALLDGALRATGLLAGERIAIGQELRHLMLGMSWLPALGFALAAVAAVRLVRRGSSPLGRNWPADLALIVAAAGLGLRAYNAFTTYGSYAPYFAAPLVLLLGILHTRIAERRPQARLAALGALGLVAAGLAAYALGGQYAHYTTAVHTPRGTFVTSAAAAPALQAAVQRIDVLTGPNQRVLAAPVDGGLYFMADRRPALRELSLLPGLIATPAEERVAIARLRSESVELAVVGAREFASWGTPTFGVNYDPLLGAYLRGAASSTATVGTLAAPVGGTNPSKGFTVYRLPG
jgi:Dolichyl-phosphate-mannose-protein mannosyltransferase